MRGRPRGQHGSLERLGPKRWRGHYWEYVGSRRVHRSCRIDGVAAKFDAQKELDRVIAAIEERKQQPTVAWLAEFRYIALRISGWTRGTANTNLSMLEQHILPAFGNMLVYDVTQVMVQGLLDRMAAKLSHSMVNRCRTILLAMFDDAVEEDLVRKNPVKRTHMPHTREISRPTLSDEDLAKLMAAAETPTDRLILHLFAIVGPRPSELFRMKWSDWDSATQMLMVPGTKTKASKAPVAVSRALAELLDSQAGQADEWMFPSAGNGPLNKNNWMNRNLKPLAESCGIAHVNYQMFRRTMATIAQHGASVKDVQGQLRHASPAMTLGVYTQIVTEGQRQAAEYVEGRIAAAGERSRNGNSDGK